MAAAEAEEGERQGYLDPDFLRLRAVNGTGVQMALVRQLLGRFGGL